MASENLVIRVYGDSLGMPRALAGIPFDQTYAELIAGKMKENNPRVYLYNRSQGGESIAVLYRKFLIDSNYFGKRPEDVLIIQSGVVDSAPHPIPRWLRNQISRLPGKVRAPIVNFLHKNRPILLRMGLSWTYTSKRVFVSLYKKWLKNAAQNFIKIYIFNIVPISDEVDRRSPGFKRKIKEYNQLIQNAVCSVKSPNICLIDVFKIISESPRGIKKYILEDGHHLSLEGHRLFSKLLLMDISGDDKAQISAYKQEKNILHEKKAV